MAEEDGLLALQDLHSDLLAFSENRLQDIERLVNELDTQIEEFRTLLDKNGKGDASRKRLNEGTLEMRRPSKRGVSFCVACGSVGA